MVAKATFRLEGENATAAAFAAALRGAQDTANRMQAIFRTAFASLSVAGVAGLYVAALAKSIKQTLEFGDELNKARIRAGMTAEAFTEIAYAARMADVEIDSLSIAIRSMQNAQVKAITGGKEQRLAFDALGLSLEQFRRLRPEQQFELLADRISRLEDPAERARAAVALFGRSGADLLPMFEKGAEGIRKAREEAQKVGQSFSAEQLERLERANDAVSRLGESFRAFAVTLIAEVAPALSRFFEDLAGVTSQRQVIDDRIRVLESQLRAGSFTPQERARRERELQILRNQRGAIEYGRWLEESAAPVQPEKLPGFKSAADALNEAGARDSTIRDAIERYQAWELRKSTPLLREARPRIIDPEELERERGDFVDALGGIEEDTQATLKRMSEQFRESTAEWSVFADEAARNMQSAFADFLFDPFEDGLKGMLKGFVDTLRRMVAEAAAARVFETLFGGKNSDGSGGVGGFLGGLLGRLFGGGKSSGMGIAPGEWDWLPGFATGGSFIVPGSGGTDSVVPLFRATPGDRVTITRPGQSAAASAAPVINITTHIDARHATTDFIRALPEVLRRNNAELEARIIEGLQRNRYRLGY